MFMWVKWGEYVIPYAGHILTRDTQLLWASLCRPIDATLVPNLNFQETRTLGNTYLKLRKM